MFKEIFEWNGSSWVSCPHLIKEVESRFIGIIFSDKVDCVGFNDINEYHLIKIIY